MVGIVPKKKSKADFFGVDGYYYIVRPDLNCYMKASNFNHGLDLEILSLHPTCRDGDHYLAHEDGRFYIIKGNYYRCVNDLTTGDGAVVSTLDYLCQEGSHYFSALGKFYVYIQDYGFCYCTNDLSTGIDLSIFDFDSRCRKGLYYFGTKESFYFVQPYDEWGAQYIRCTDLSTGENYTNFAFHPDVISFLPGGISITKGPSYGRWVCIKTIKNDSQDLVEWKKRVMKRVGYEKDKMCSIEHNWKVSATVTAETGGVVSLIAQAQFSLTAEYGGASVNTERENWSEATEVEETLSVCLQPGHQIHVFVFVLGMGKDAILHCRDMRLSNTPKPPSDIPLPPAQN